MFHCGLAFALRHRNVLHPQSRYYDTLYTRGANHANSARRQLLLPRTPASIAPGYSLCLLLHHRLHSTEHFSHRRTQTPPRQCNLSCSRRESKIGLHRVLSATTHYHNHHQTSIQQEHHCASARLIEIGLLSSGLPKPRPSCSSTTATISMSTAFTTSDATNAARYAGALD